MPHIEEKDLVNLYKEVDVLKKKEDDLIKENAELEKENKHFTKNSKLLLFLIIISALTAFVFGLLYFQSTSENSQMLLARDAYVADKIDSIQSLGTIDELEDDVESDETSSDENSDAELTEPQNTSNEDTDNIDKGIVYTIQIGAFKELDLSNYGKNELKNFLRIPNKGFHTYSIGKLTSMSKAKKFLKQIQKMGIKDAFILPLKNGKIISLTKADKEAK